MDFEKVEIVKLWQVRMTASDKIRVEIVYTTKDDMDSNNDYAYCWRGDSCNRCFVYKYGLFIHRPTKEEKKEFLLRHLDSQINSYKDDIKHHSDDIVRCTREIVGLEQRMERIKNDEEKGE